MALLAAIRRVRAGACPRPAPPAERRLPATSRSHLSASGIAYRAGLPCDPGIVPIDASPTIDGALRPAPRAADLASPVTPSRVQRWAAEGVPTLTVLDRARAGIRLAASVRAAFETLPAKAADATMGSRVAFAEALGAGLGVRVLPQTQQAAAAVAALTDKRLRRLDA